MHRLVLLAALAAGCDAHTHEASPERSPAGQRSPAATQKIEAKTVTLTKDDHAKHVTIPLGGEVKVMLPAKLGTGQTWQLTDQQLTHVKLREGYPKTEGGGKPGGEQTQVFIFDAIAAGSDEVKLTYGRPKSSTPNQTFSAKIDVVDDTTARPSP